MANPRKFSEKIALHHQKQAEETAAFEKIMREVSDVTNKGSTPCHSRPSDDDKVKTEDLLICTQVISTFRSGSLPNVAAPQGQSTHNAEVKPEEMTLVAQWTQLNSPSMGSGGRATHRSRSITHAGSSVGPIRPGPADRKDHSPYGSSRYLSPPPDGSWRRTNSDSALHQSSSLGSPGSVSPHHTHHAGHLPGHHGYHPVQHASPHHQQHSHSQHSLHTAHLHQQHHYMPMAGPQHSQHRRVTDSNIDSILAMAINQHNNPERPRSSCDSPRVPGISVYPSHDMNSQNQAYSSNCDQPQLQVPICGGTGSLPDLTSVRYDPQNDGTDDHSSNSPCYSSSPVSASPATLSPTQLPLQSSRHSPQYTCTTTDHNAALAHNQNHLSVPNNRYPHQNKGMTAQEQSWMQAGYQQQQCSPPSVHSSHSNINIPSPTMGMGVMAGSPLQHSAGGSPGGAGGPGGGHDGDTPHNDAYYNNQALLQHFQQFSMTDAPVSNLNYINSTNNSPHYTQSNARTPERDQHGISSGNNGDTTMCGIPDIILTDFSNTSSGVADLSKELGVPSHLDTSLFPDDEGLREGLDPIDFDGLQMLTDPDLAVSDPTTEDAFRLDRL